MKTNFTKRLLGACRQVVLACAMISAIGISDAAAQTCTVDSNTSLDPTTCSAVILASDLASDGTSALVFHSVSLDGTAIALSALIPATATSPAIPAGASVTVSTPGTYKYQITDASGCWGTFNVEDKSGPICSNDGMGDDATGDCYFADGAMCADGPLVSTCGTAVYMPGNADNYLVDRVLVRKINDPAARLTDDWALLEANDFKDCTGIDGDPWAVDTDLEGCDLLAMTDADLAAALGVLEYSITQAKAKATPVTPSSLDGAAANTPWEVCQILAKSWYAQDASGNVSPQAVECTQIMFVYRPTFGHIQISNYEMAQCDEEVTDIGPYFNDCGPTAARVFLADVDGLKSKFVVVSKLGDEIQTCGEGYKQINHFTVIDWCSSSDATSVPLEGTQVIEVKDTEPPLVTDEGSVTFNADPFDCSGSIVATAADATDNCSGDALTWITRISYAGVDGHGSPSGPVTQVRNENGAEFFNVPVGVDVTISWTAVDPCGNESIAKEEDITTTDDSDPVAICNDALNVTLVNISEGDQRARIYAEDVDDSSQDNCGIDKIQVKREGGTYGDFVEVDCDDVLVDGGIVVYLKVTDTAGNPSECWSKIIVEDKTVPVVVPLADINVTCLEDVPAGSKDDVKFTNVGCNAPTVSDPMDADYSLDCGEASFTRTWTVTPVTNGGHSSSSSYPVTQKINIAKVESWKITFPAQPSVIDCGIGQIAPDPLKIESFLTEDTGCDRWVLSSSDHTFSGATATCKSVVRKYKLVNECHTENHLGTPIQGESGEMYTAKDDDITKIGTTDTDVTDSYHGVFHFTHKFDFVDGTAPVVSFVTTDTCIISDACNSGQVNISNLSLVENCGVAQDTAILLLDGAGNTVSSSPTKNSDGTFSFSNLAAGTYSVRIDARDGCGNVGRSTGSSHDVQGDCKAPSIIAHHAYTATMENGEAEIWALDLSKSVDDKCTDDAVLEANLLIDIWVDADGDEIPTDADWSKEPSDDLTSSITLTCDNTNNAGIAVVLLWTKDEAGNYETIWVPVTLNQCVQPLGGGGAAASIAGSITNENNEEIDQVMVKFQGSDQSVFEELFSGDYVYTVPMATDITITPEKDLGYMNGVSTADLVKLQRHILGISPLSSAYQLIAADVNSDERVNTKDMLHISRLILDLYEELPNSTSWKFVSKDHQFANPLSPWGFPQAMNYEGLDTDVQADFVGIKIGDLTGNASPSNLLGTDNTIVGEMTIAIDETTLTPGQSKVVEFMASDFTDFAGYQFTISLGENVKLTQVTPGVLPNMSEDANFGLNRLDQGTITTTWSNAQGITLEDGDVLFSLTLESSEIANLSDVISINSKQTAAEAYNNDLDVHTVAAQFSKTESAAFQLFQNQPNPFNGETVIGFNMPKAGVATLKVMNIAGQVLTTQSADFVRGYNQISLNKSELNASGVLYYQIETDNHSATKKMVILE